MHLQFFFFFFLLLLRSTTTGAAARRKEFPQVNADVCVCLLTYKRPFLFNRTLAAIINYFEEEETDVKYEIAWVDNGSEPEQVEEMMRFARSVGGVEYQLMMGYNTGLAYAFNSLYFRLCKARYVITLEEDWEYQRGAAGKSNRQVPLIKSAIRVLKQDENVSGVLLRVDTFDTFATVGVWKQISSARNRDRPLEYRTYCMNLKSGAAYGAYTNGASIYDKERLLQRVGMQAGEPGNPDGVPHYYGEGNYAVRCGFAGLCTALVRWDGMCNTIPECNAGLFVHIGEGFSHKLEKKSAKNEKFLFYKTKLWDVYVKKEQEDALSKKQEL